MRERKRDRERQVERQRERETEVGNNWGSSAALQQFEKNKNITADHCLK